MSNDRPQKRVEPAFFSQGKPRRELGGLRGERLDIESADPDRQPRGRNEGERRRADPKIMPGTNSAPKKFDEDDMARRGTAKTETRTGRPRASKPRKRGSLLGWSIRWMITLGIWMMVALLGVVAYYGYDLPDVGNFAALTRRPSVTLVGADGQGFATFGDLYYDVVPLNEMPPYLPRAVIATEDRRFYEHFGIDPLGIARAIFEDLRAHKLRQGGSTITQQLAKNLFLTSERSIKRKVQEVMLAVWLERKFTKDQILTIYLNRVYLGNGAYGVEAAARKYFNKSAREVTLYEAAVLAGLLKAPSKFNPTHDPDLTAQRAGQVLASMVDAGYLTPDKAANAARERSALKPASVAAWRGRYFADWAMDQVRDLLGYIDRDIVVKTTLDPTLQRFAEDAVNETLEKEGEKLDIEQGALVALGRDGEIKALVGGRDYRQSQFNRATQALRQPGSSFKPFVYLAGLESGYDEDSVFDDAPITIGGWSPNNYNDKYYGRVTLKEAFARSLNSVAAQLAEKAGVGHVIEVAHRLGITSELRKDASIALGTSEVSLLELTSAYGGFADGGKGVWPYGILEIDDRDGHVLYRRAGSGPGQLMTPRQAATMVDMMSAVMTMGTGKAAAIGRPAGGKTGTTQDYRDAWFIGFTPDLVAGVWVGNDDRSPMKKVTGGGPPAQNWRNFMAAALKDTTPHDFPEPPTIIQSVLQSILGASGSSSESFGASRSTSAPPNITKIGR